MTTSDAILQRPADATAMLHMPVRPVVLWDMWWRKRLYDFENDVSDNVTSVREVLGPVRAVQRAVGAEIEARRGTTTRNQV